MLELQKLLTTIETMSEELAHQSRAHREQTARAQEVLRAFAQVDDALLDKVERAADLDPSWRGARPVGERLDEHHAPEAPDHDASLIAVDGSQIYPDRHGMALYYLINTGGIVLRQGTGQAPLTFTRPQVFFREKDLFNEAEELIDSQTVNNLREMAELEELARLVAEERAYWQGDLDRRVVAMMDGPLLLWVSEREYEQSSHAHRRLQEYLACLDAIRAAGGLLVGYVDRPRSANVLRLLHVAELELMAIDKETLRATRYRGLSDRFLFDWLRPQERSALFASTSRINRRDFAPAGHEIYFFYLNVAQADGPDDANIVRVDVPAWVAAQPETLDLVQQAVYRDCRGTGYPYVLARAHELAVVTQQERRQFEQMLATQLMRRGRWPYTSTKAYLKSLL
ncbi:MAG: DNA double-strand break repair nuclease NurA [Caldilineae bacterium]|nr:MAG: DNA double-strand break repair nuclease NurA [Caldilineae bacterium]